MSLLLKFALGPCWGLFENRAWKEHGENWIGRHFKTYHLLMFLLFAGWNAFGLSWSQSGLLEWSFFMVYDILTLDVSWWIHRYLDYTRRVVLFGWVVFLGRKEAMKSYNMEFNAWHARSDWDNWLGLPLLLRTYWWWYVFAVACIVLGVLAL